MSASANDSVLSAWDPKSPATLLLPTNIASRNDGEDGSEEKKAMNFASCDTGIGCNTFESSAIMNLIDARDAYLDERKTSSNHHQALRQLSRGYRKALANCLHDWTNDIEQRDEISEEKTKSEKKGNELVDLDLLRATYAITHLSEIFLMSPSGPQDHNGIIENMGYGYENGAWNLPGAVTADTVRYLRKHHFGDIYNLFDSSVVDEMYELWQPDQQDGDNGNQYWEMVEAYVMWGCLEDAWDLLSHHSIVRRYMELNQELGTDGSPFNDYQTAALAEDGEGFRALMSILLSAPLPGSRNNAFDDGFDTSENKNGDSFDPSETKEELIDGIPSSAYRLWEPNSAIGNSNNSSRGYYVNFEPNSAHQVHAHWKQAIDSLPALKRLRQRIPQLDKILALLTGNFRDIEFNSWQEEMCAELLYKIPNIKLMNINVRAAALVQKHANDTEEKHSIDEMMLNIMRGNAGEVLKALHGFGGGSGAALPAVMTSLLSQLLSDANLLNDPTDTELLIGASSSIRSSLAVENHHDLGTRLAVRLLLPHVEIDSDLRITASLVDTLEHHSPKSDAEANSILSLCRKLIERKNVRVLDGCNSICLSRYRRYMGDRIPGGAVHWLLVGMELESLVYCGGQKRTGDWQRALASGACYRRLVLDFTAMSRSLVKTLLGEEKGASLFYERGKEMIAATKEELPNGSNLVSFVPAVKLLENIIVIAGALVERKDNSIIASSIVSCLEERPNDEDDGVVSSLARSLNWDLLRLAIEILDIDAKRIESQENRNSARSISSFDVKGMGVLLSVFTMETKARELKEKNDTGATGLNEEEVQRSRLILGEGLKRAFLAENSMKKAAKDKKSKSLGATIYTANFSKHSREEQEHAVQMMLEY
uniref:Nuclear pore complex protein Nup85 n=1 Tax=Pseudo-nitzschia arenysensis TaxID=697910 RepID=A0A7R9ZU78_9STRA|mmetsp:Transcript_673/g.1621  ORF Transcript_673/g.1621 Transcript_673/m.1621 type:complete len:880 (+) Transcript_673:107-2746(+)|eukprot:CAMPEP_0116137734 /NCGR_PEP_ID=MMETSP0329-20121206/12400_1 /TAXON_ID=697910 /ORGANISM="Pseudo-nitzschia arenysensis, Strain B593" /LENGTH=879 /DNA_ID=CAMNT_0003632657 /DNA_START=80 /DNA_END=2719 /DNA_ORIENTATION=+